MARIQHPHNDGHIPWRASDFTFRKTRSSHGIMALLTVLWSDDVTLDREAYEAYANHTGWRSLATGQPLPQWEQLSPEIKAAWKVTAAWVAGKVSGNHDWKIPARDRQCAEKIKAEAMTGDHECDHQRADDLLCQLADDLGCEESVKAYEAVGKYYA